MGSLKTNMIILGRADNFAFGSYRPNRLLRGRVQTGPGGLYHQKQSLRLQRQNASTMRMRW